MQIYFYDTRINDDLRTTLVKAGCIDYGAEILNNPKLIAEMLNETVSLSALGEEHCYMLALNSKCRPLGMFLISKGTVSQSLAGAREIFMRALIIGASNIILCHNHPSTDCNPNKTDLQLTKRLKEAGKLLDVPLSDHIIVGRDSYYSFKEHGTL